MTPCVYLLVDRTKYVGFKMIQDFIAMKFCGPINFP